MRTLAYDKDALEKAVNSARIAKSAIQSYIELTGEKMTAGKRKLIVDRFNAVEAERMERAVRCERARMRASTEHEKEFAPILAARTKQIEAIMANALISDERYQHAKFEVALFHNLLSIKLQMPAFWSEAAGLSVNFMSYRQASDITADRIEISYGFGGNNPGFSSIEIATQKANALLVMCDIAKIVATMDWKDFVGYYLKPKSGLKVERQRGAGNRPPFLSKIQQH